MSQPLGERKVLKTIDLAEHLQEYQIGVAGVLDVVQQGLLHVSDVSLLKIHCPLSVPRRDHCHSSLATDVVLPFVRVWMPVQFPQSSGMNGDQCHRCGGGFE